MTQPLRQSSQSAPGSAFEIPEMDEETFSYIVALISTSAGFSVQRSSRALVTSRLWKHVRRLGAASWREYREILTTSGAAVQQEVLNLLTTNKTDFFREVQHFEHIQRALIERSGFAANCSGVLNAWIAACSRGHEASTLAMVLRDCQNRCPWLKDFHILATDINTDVLAIGEEGVYSASEVDGAILPKYQRGNLLRGTGQNTGKYRMANELKQHIKFRQHNLIAPVNPPTVVFDLIMVRNVFIYFNEQNIIGAVNGLMKNLKTGGELMIGLCEAMPSGVKGLNPLAPSVFRKGP